MSEQMKPPPRRRTAGRVLNTGQQTTAAPPTAAELTREQLAAEEAAAESTSESLHSQVTPAEVPAASAPAPGAATVAAQEAPQAKAPAGGTLGAPRRADAGPPAAALPAELALRPAHPPAETGPFPGTGQQANAPRPEDVIAAGTDSTAWTQGAGRPKGLPSTATVLNQRSIHREGLDVSVASALRLKKRLKRFALDNELDHLPLGDIVTVALDEWLTVRGF